MRVSNQFNSEKGLRSTTVLPSLFDSLDILTKKKKIEK